ncbi:MAG: hypothetical protein WKG07_18510 [Hymenobacter sp.]
MAEFNAPQVTGVAVAPGVRYSPFRRAGTITRLFRWRWWGPTIRSQPYPDAGWCTWNDSVKAEPQKHWICPQAGYVDAQGMLWIVDPAAPGLKFTVPGGPKLVKTDPTTGRSAPDYSLPRGVAPRHSYLNDVRIDLQNNPMPTSPTPVPARWS